MNNNLTHIVMILDKSGSMHHLSNDTIGSYNSFINEQKNIEGECTISTVLFNHEMKYYIKNKNIKDVEEMTKEDYSATGNTSLYDAVCTTIDDTGKYLASMEEQDRPSKIMVVIITDGQDNRSKEFGSLDVKNRIQHQRDNYNWKFMFIGANIEVEKYAMDFGIPRGFSAQYTASSMGTKSVYTAVGQTLSSFRGTGEVSTDNLKGII